MSKPEPTKLSMVGEVSNKKHSERVVRSHVANEFVFAVVGHVGSGTSQIATMLQSALENASLRGGPFDATILKARNEIQDWAKASGENVPTQDNNDLQYDKTLQVLGDAMRLKSNDNAAVARALIEKVRVTRAAKLHVDPQQNAPMIPDGKRRAYILDSIRHPAEVHLLRRVYQSAFALAGIVCDEEKRLQRITVKYKNAGVDDAKEFMKRDAKAAETHGQRVSDTFHLSDYFIDNSADRLLKSGQANRNWDIADQLSRLVKLITHLEIVRPTMSETAMHTAYGAQMRSACLSRQVGAALVDSAGNVIATGTNEVPKAGGGLYGEEFEKRKYPEPRDDRCAYRTFGAGFIPFCSNTREQNEIIDELIALIPQLSVIKDKNSLRTLKTLLMESRIGNLLEFSRAVHAEMDALLSAGRVGVSPVGSRLFVTTFPCHYCARHAVSAGVDEVQYIEPYPKSRALKLHADSITTDTAEWTPPSKGGSQVLFRPFTGVAPRLYARAFLKDRELKGDETGEIRISDPQSGSPWDVSRVSYPQLELELARSVSIESGSERKSTKVE